MSVKRILERYSQRSTIQGVAHMAHTTNRRRKTLWLILTMLGSVCSAYHMYEIWNQYATTPVSVSLQKRSGDAVFPDVTMCNLHPISTSVTRHSVTLKEYIRDRWDNFRAILAKMEETTNATQLIAEVGNPWANLSKVQMYEHFLDEQEKLTAIFWASEDTRDLGNDDDIMLLHCQYKERNCSAKDFKLVQNFDLWNCFTFSPENRTVESNMKEKGLEMIIYTNNFLRGDNDTEIRVDSEYLTSKMHQVDFAEVMSARNLLPSGIRLLLHEPKSYPYPFRNALDIGNGRQADVRFLMEKLTLVDRPKKPCSTSRKDVHWNYMAYSGVKKSFMKKYKIYDYDYLVKHQQDDVWKACGCFSHTLPINTSKNKLCYFIGDPKSSVEISKLVKRIRCHDKTLQFSEASTKRWRESFRKQQSCETNVYKKWINTTPWPNKFDALQLYQKYVISVLSGKTVGGQPRNHLVKEKIPILNDIISIGGNLMEGLPPGDWKTTMTLTKRNFIRVSVFAKQQKSSLYEESPSYFFWEAFAEIGGTFGLYIGMTLLTLCELFELVGLLVAHCISSKRRANCETAAT